jgi:hypothetical protein
MTMTPLKRFIQLLKIVGLVFSSLVVIGSGICGVGPIIWLISQPDFWKYAHDTPPIFLRWVVISAVFFYVGLIAARHCWQRLKDSENTSGKE